jgi:hypothetical protein
MRLITRENAACAIVSLGAEEAMILLQPGKMVRQALEHCPGRQGARFLTPLDNSGGVLALLPPEVASALLQAPATHAVEQELQILLFDFPRPIRPVPPQRFPVPLPYGSPPAPDLLP